MPIVDAVKTCFVEVCGFWQLLAFVPFGVILVIVFLLQRSATPLNPAASPAASQT